jgi:virginiamycin A acetyltransferase
MARQILKYGLTGLALVLTGPLALLTGFGRIGFFYDLFAQAVALVPGLPGDYLRTAFYYLTLRESSLYSRVSFGTFFAQSNSSMGRGVYVGAYCVLGSCRIGDRTQIASQVQILSGGHQHGRDSQGRILGSDEGNFTQVSIGADCWIGAAAIIMADVGEGTTVGAGSVVTRKLPPRVISVGNPARVIKEAARA